MNFDIEPKWKTAQENYGHNIFFFFPTNPENKNLTFDLISFAWNTDGNIFSGREEERERERGSEKDVYVFVCHLIQVPFPTRWNRFVFLFFLHFVK